MTECLTWIQDKLGFLRSHIRRKGLSKSSALKLQARGASASATTAHDISRASTDTDSMEIRVQSTDTTLQPQKVTSPTAASGHSSFDQEVMDQFKQMRNMLSSFLGQKQERTTCTAFYNYLASDVEGLEEKDFKTFRNEAVKLLSNIKSKAEECGHQPQQPQQQPLSHSSSELQHLCHRHFNSHSSLLQLKGNTS